MAEHQTSPPPATVWDTKTQTYHGGQEYRFINNFVEDFSVTTNYLGAPKPALEAARDAVYTCHHYPPANQEPAKSSLAAFLWPTDHATHHDRLLLGNGASELIDLVVRKARTEAGNGEVTWKAGPWDVQYKEYQRSAETNGFTVLQAADKRKVRMTCVVNPCNPTGDYMPVEEIKAWILENVEPGGTVIVDESMQPWHSSSFRTDSLTSQHAFLSLLHANHGISAYIVHSWTKLWSCTGLRLGSVVCPTSAHCSALKRIQVPWSVNSPALAFLDAVVCDDKYLTETWEGTPRLRRYVVEKLGALEVATRDGWALKGREFLSWVWVDTKSVKVAEEAVRRAREAGVPVRSGGPGYERPTYVRVAVRKEKEVDVLIEAWKYL